MLRENWTKSMSPDTKAWIKENISTLNYVKGEGFLHRQKKSLIDERFLLVGYGGAGCRAVAELKETLRRISCFVFLAPKIFEKVHREKKKY